MLISWKCQVGVDSSTSLRGALSEAIPVLYSTPLADEIILTKNTLPSEVRLPRHFVPRNDVV